jgi:hypothetical protein
MTKVLAEQQQQPELEDHHEIMSERMVRCKRINL